MLSEPRPDIQHFFVHNLVENQCRKNGKLLVFVYG